MDRHFINVERSTCIESWQDGEALRLVGFYFSYENYNSDWYLQGLSDRFGWVSFISLVQFHGLRAIGATNPYRLARLINAHSSALNVEVNIETCCIRPTFRRDMYNAYSRRFMSRSTGNNLLGYPSYINQQSRELVSNELHNRPPDHMRSTSSYASQYETPRPLPPQILQGIPAGGRLEIVDPDQVEKTTPTQVSNNIVSTEQQRQNSRFPKTIENGSIPVIHLDQSNGANDIEKKKMVTRSAKRSNFLLKACLGILGTPGKFAISIVRCVGRLWPFRRKTRMQNSR